MKKRLLSWLLVLTMVTSLIPCTLVTTAFAADNTSAQASGQAGKTTVKVDNKWPGDMNADITDVLITGTTIPGPTLTVESGKTLIVHGSGTLSGSGRTEKTPFFIVKDGGHLVLDQVTVTANSADAGTVVVEKGGLLDLGYNDQKDRIVPSITGNTRAMQVSAARNLVIADGATVRLNAKADKNIGITYAGSTPQSRPTPLLEGGRYTLRKGDNYANGETGITADDSAMQLFVLYDNLVIRSKAYKVLFWSPDDFLNQATGTGTEANGKPSGGTNNSPHYHLRLEEAFGKNNVTKLIGQRVGHNGSTQWKNQAFFNQWKDKYTRAPLTKAGDLTQYDLIYILYPYGCDPNANYYAGEVKLLMDYLDQGGRIFIQAENTDFPTTYANERASKLAENLGSGFEIINSPAIDKAAIIAGNSSLIKGLNLTQMQAVFASPIVPKGNIPYDTIFSSKARDNTTHAWAVDQNAGREINGLQWGKLTVVADGNFWRDFATTGQPLKFMQNIRDDTATRRLLAAVGINPNATGIKYQATTTTTTASTNYRTPYAALQKAVEGNTVTLLTNSRAADGGLTPTRDELLFQEATLAYEAGSQYDGNTIHADTAGVYLDITKTGEVNLHSGTVTVTPKDKDYVLTMNGTMDPDGNAITEGCKITSATKYQLIADDPTSPILSQNGGKASIVIPNAGESVTVDYGGGKTVTYTAKENNEKVYLGWYQVNKNTPASATWTDSDKAWYGQPFTTTLNANTGFEVNGEKLTVADTVQVGNYTMVKTGTVQDPADANASWTTYESTEKDRENKPEVTIKQKHLHTGNVDRNGEAIVIVNDVRADITIGAADGAVNAASPTIYVVGVGQRAGQADVQLWEYTTTRNTKDGNLQKPVNGWPWEKWKVVKAASATGTQLDYTNNKNGIQDNLKANAGTTGLNTTNPTAEYDVDLFHGDKVVVFYYDWNMVNVTIKATDANGHPIPDYTDQVVEYESNKKTTITAPNLIGYQPVGGQNTKDFTPSETNKEITFQYEKTTGNLIYKAVYVDAAGAKRELGTFSGGTLVQGQAPNKSAQYAPRFDNYELADKTADGVASAESYTGTDITVTYTYKAKVKTIPVEAYVETTSGVRLLNDTTTYKDITTGQTITVTAPDIAGYKVKGAASQTVFVTNDTSDGQKVVFLYEKDDDNNAYVLVKLVDSSNRDKLISSYQVPGVKDKAQLIKAPAAPYGYKADPAHPNEDRTVTPTGTQAPYKAEVVFKYVPNVHTVTIKLEDVSETTAKPLTVNNYVTSYKVVDGEGLTITAPSIYGYTMAENSESVKVLTNITEDKTVTFQYEPIDKQMVYIHVKGVGSDGKTLFESNESVTHGTASKEVNVFTLPGLKLASATVGKTDKTTEVANGKLTVDLRSVTKGGTVEVLLTYESNMANVTVKAMYNDTELQSYTTSLEKGITATINAPSVPGYTADPSSKTVKPGDTEAENTVTFNYTKDNGNVTVVVVDKDGNKELYRKDGGTVARGANIVLTGKAAAPTIEYYTTPTAPKRVTVNGTEVNDLTNYTYDGVGDIIVTYEYTRKTQNVTIVKKDADTKKVIDRTQVISDVEVGKTLNFTSTAAVTTPDGYIADASNPTAVFVEDRAGQEVVFWYRQDENDRYVNITVKLTCGGEVFETYTVSAIKGQTTRVSRPSWTGYKPAENDPNYYDKTPTDNSTEVEFKYTIDNPKTVSVVLHDDTGNKTLNPPTGYTDSYKLKAGDSVNIQAPHIASFDPVSAELSNTTDTDAVKSSQLVTVSYDKLQGNATVTFHYEPKSSTSFVTHTIKFMVMKQGANHEVYSYSKLIPKGTGAKVEYKEDDVKYTLPGYAFADISYTVGADDHASADAVTDLVDATITYHFEEDAAQIVIEQECTVEPDKHSETVTLTGYRKGQTNIKVMAPLLDGHALEPGEPTFQIIKGPLDAGTNNVTFKYVGEGDLMFKLVEVEIGDDGTATEKRTIQLIKAGINETYNPKTQGNALNLSDLGYTFAPCNLATDPFNSDNNPEITHSTSLTTSKTYTVCYTKKTREVDFVAVDKTKLDAKGKTLEEALKEANFDTNYVIKTVTPVPPEKARVGETYKAVAQSFNGWALRDDYSKYYEVEDVADPTDHLKVYFMYVPKASGTVVIRYNSGTADQAGMTLNEYSFDAVAGEKVSITPPTYILNGKYKLRDGQDSAHLLSVEATKSTEKTFYYEPNFVKVTVQTVTDDGTASPYATHEVNKTDGSGQQTTNNLTLTPPNKAGYTLVGITATGTNLTDGGTDKLPTQYTNNQLALTGLTQAATVTYYYKTTKASEYQTTLTVEYKYNGYDLAEAKTINANTNDANSIDILAFDGYKATTYSFTDGTGTPSTNGIADGSTAVSVTPTQKNATLTITYVRPDGSVVLPGGDKQIPAPNDKDNVTVKPDDGTQLTPNPKPTPPAADPKEGSVTIPDKTTGTVTRPAPDDTTGNKKEEVKVPSGTIIDPDGTIHLPDNGGTIKPGDKLPSATPTGYISVVYKANGGTGDDVIDLIKTGQTIKARTSPFTNGNQTFTGWNTADNGVGGTAYQRGDEITIPNSGNTITLYAQWGKANFAHSTTITYLPNDGTGVTNKKVVTVGSNTGADFKANLLDTNPFSVTGWTFGGWHKASNGVGSEPKQLGAEIDATENVPQTWYAQWYRVNADGSITVPGEDGNPKNEDTNATAKGNGTTAPTRNEKGEIEVPKGGSVTLPDGSVIGMPDGGKLLPNGTVIINRPDTDKDGKSDGTITIPGKTDPTKPDVTDKDGQPETNATVIDLVYQINNGETVPDVTVKVVKGDSVAILENQFTWTGYQFVNWMGTDDKVYKPGTNYTAGDQNLELHAQWSKQNTNGSIELPGKDGSMTTPKDNVLVTPDNHPVGNLEKKDDGSVEVKGDGATVNRPKDPAQLDQGRENIKVPEGTIVKPDGTIILPDGGTINPDGKLPGATPTGYISVVYKANGGTGDDVIDLIKTGQTIKARTSPFTNGNQTFTGWNTADNGVGGTAYQRGDEITIPNSGNTITLYAQWGKANFAHSTTITYLPNDGTDDTNKKVVTVGSNTDANFKANLLDTNPFSVPGWTLGGWHTVSNGVGSNPKQLGAEIDAAENVPQTWYAQWYKVGANGSITVPGDGNPNTEGDNVTANGTGVTREPDTGNISIPAGGNVVKGNGETIALPNGGTLKPDGTLIINKPNSGGQIEVKPDGSTDPNANVVTLTYQANNGTNDTRKVYATKDEAIAPLAENTFSYIDHAFLYWKSGDTIFKTNGTITPTEAMTLFAVWAKANPDGSKELPGKDGELEAPDNKDNVIVTPGNGGTLDGPKQPDGSVEVKGDGATVNRPKDPNHPEQGKENIKVPDGTIVKPDGTIKLPDGTEIAPDQRIPDDVTPTDYFVVTYEPGDGSGDVIRDVITKDADTTLRDEDTFTAPSGKTFDGWLDGATKHNAGKTLTVDKSMTFTAQWKVKNPDTTVYPVTIYYHSVNGKTTQRETGSSKQFSATLNANSFTAPVADWTFMGWTTDANGGKNGTFYKDGGMITLDVTKPDPDLYAVWYHKDDTTGTITLPGKDNNPTTADNNVTVNPGTGTAPTVKNDSNEGYIEANGGNTVQQPAGTITVIDGPVKVYPDGTVYVPEGSKVQLPDGSEIKGETTIDPDGNPDGGNTKPVQKPDGTIVLPGQNGVIDNGGDDITIAPAGPNQPAGDIGANGDVTITNPSGADVNIPGSNPADFKVPNGTIIKPNGDMALLYTIRYVDGSGTEIKAADVKFVQRGFSMPVDAATITGYTVSGEATKTASGEVSANLADYIITFTYTKNSTGGGGSSGGGGGGGSSTVSSYTIKASAGANGTISPNGSVSVARGKDQTFTISAINGYRIADVLVDGKSVGNVSTYTFENVKANHTIEAKFVKQNSIIADPTETGVAGWLQTSEHIAYLGGYGNGKFGPTDCMTRAQAAQMFYNLLLNKNVDITVKFTDVPADAWYGNAVHTLASLGIIKGIGNDQFAPNRTITRAEFAVIAMRFANLSATVTNPFTDIASNDWYYNAVTSAVSYGWITGYSDGTFRPYATITRAEVATIVNRMLARTADRDFVDSSAVTRFDDVPNTYWAYYSIAEATNAHTHTIDNDGVESWGKLK